MDRTAVNEVKLLLEGFLRAKGVDLVEIICRYEGRDLVVRILLDYPGGGITLGECTALNKEISLMLEEKYVSEERYALEVSSPGLDRPLKSKNDFLRCRNKRVRVFLSDLINGKLEWEGLIDKVDEQAVYVKRGEEVIEIPLCKINKAKQVF
ncbi:MAG: ribosome maturation factor RimP [Candidatus Omnitrophota bacterium]